MVVVVDGAAGKLKKGVVLLFSSALHYHKTEGRERPARCSLSSSVASRCHCEKANVMVTLLWQL